MSDSAGGAARPDIPQSSRKRRRRGAHVDQSRRNGYACRRCKIKKTKCNFSAESTQSVCEPCAKAGSECVFDVAADGIPRGAAYISVLEAQVQSLQTEVAELRATPRPSTACHDAPVASPATTGSRQLGLTQSPAASLAKSHISLPTPTSTQPTAIDSISDITLFNFLQIGPDAAKREVGALPELPNDSLAGRLLETVYLYTQARYCIFDWVSVFAWHRRRESICFPDNEDLDAQIGAYFIWMAYSIGAQLVPGSEHLSTAYYARAIASFHVVVAQQNLTAVQGLLTLTQFHFRAAGGPSIWHLVGMALRICIELGYHRKAKKSLDREDTDPYTIELQKRTFWSVYCFDRFLGMMFKRPFGISDFDIDVDIAVDIDLERIDQDEISALQARQAAGDYNLQKGTVTTMSASLHHLRMYRIRSRIITRFTGPNALPPSHDAMDFFSELAEWRRQAPQSASHSAALPRQSDERVEATYFEATLLLVRPILAQVTIDADLLRKCAELSADACKNARTLSLSPGTHSSPISVYNCFRCGITLLHCLAVEPKIMSLKDTHNALSSCSSALAVYTQKTPTALKFLQLFEKLSDYHLSDGDVTSGYSPDIETLRSILHRITSSGPSETLELFRILVDGDEQDVQTLLPQSGNTADTIYDTNSFWGLDSVSTEGMDLIMPYEMFSDIPFFDISFQSMADFRAGPS